MQARTLRLWGPPLCQALGKALGIPGGEVPVRLRGLKKKLCTSYKFFDGKVKISLAISVQYPSFYVELINRLMGEINDRSRERNYVF